MHCGLARNLSGGRKFLNLYHGFAKFLAHNTAGEAELEHFSDLAEPAVLSFRAAFQAIASKSSSKLREVVLGFLEEDLELARLSSFVTSLQQLCA